METHDTKMKELMDFAQDIAQGLYYMKQTELAGVFPVDGKQVVLNISVKVEDTP